MEAHMRNRMCLVLIHVFVPIVFAYPLFPQVSFFQPPIFQGTGNLFVADFNGDGKPDVLTSDGTLQLGTGGGAFAAPTTVQGPHCWWPISTGMGYPTFWNRARTRCSCFWETVTALSNPPSALSAMSTSLW